MADICFSRAITGTADVLVNSIRPRCVQLRLHFADVDDSDAGWVNGILKGLDQAKWWVTLSRIEDNCPILGPAWIEVNNGASGLTNINIVTFTV